MIKLDKAVLVELGLADLPPAEQQLLLGLIDHGKGITLPLIPLFDTSQSSIG